MYLNGLDQCIRARYGCSLILIHHIGHAVRDRARGPFGLIGNTDANFVSAQATASGRSVRRAARADDGFTFQGSIAS